jgi:hypothetical protein
MLRRSSTVVVRGQAWSRQPHGNIWLFAHCIALTVSAAKLPTQAARLSDPVDLGSRNSSQGKIRPFPAWPFGTQSRLRQGADQPDAPQMTLYKIDELSARRVVFSHNAVWMFLRREGLRFKTVRP